MDARAAAKASAAAGWAAASAILARAAAKAMAAVERVVAAATQSATQGQQRRPARRWRRGTSAEWSPLEPHPESGRGSRDQEKWNEEQRSRYLATLQDNKLAI